MFNPQQPRDPQGKFASTGHTDGKPAATVNNDTDTLEHCALQETTRNNDGTILNRRETPDEPTNPSKDNPTTGQDSGSTPATDKTTLTPQQGEHHAHPLATTGIGVAMAGALAVGLLTAGVTLWVVARKRANP